MGLAAASSRKELGFKMGWQFSPEYTAIVENINETHEPAAGGEIAGVIGPSSIIISTRVGGGDGGHGGGNGGGNGDGGGGGGGGGHGGGNFSPDLAWGISLDRDGNVGITNDIKEAHEGLMEVGVLFVLQWKNPKKALGGKFDWIGAGEDGGSWHDVNRQNIVHKLEDPVGRTKSKNYWFDNGAKPGPYVVSKMLKQTGTIGGVIVTVGGLWKAMDWAHIQNGEK